MASNKKISNLGDENSDQQFDLTHVDLKSKKPSLAQGAKFKLLPIRLDKSVNDASKAATGCTNFNPVKIDLKLNDLQSLLDLSMKEEEKGERMMVFVMENRASSDPLQEGKEDRSMRVDESKNKLKPVTVENLPVFRKKETTKNNSNDSWRNDGSQHFQERSAQTSSSQTSNDVYQRNTSNGTSTKTDTQLPLLKKTKITQTMKYCCTCEKCINSITEDSKLCNPATSLQCQCVECHTLREEIKLKRVWKNKTKQKPESLATLLNNIQVPEKCNVCVRNKSSGNQTKGVQSLRNNEERMSENPIKLPDTMFQMGDKPSLKTLTVHNGGVNYKILTRKMTDENEFCCQRRQSSKKCLKCCKKMSK